MSLQWQIDKLTAKIDELHTRAKTYGSLSDDELRVMYSALKRREELKTQKKEKAKAHQSKKYTPHKETIGKWRREFVESGSDKRMSFEAYKKWRIRKVMQERKEHTN